MNWLPNQWLRKANAWAHQGRLPQRREVQPYRPSFEQLEERQLFSVAALLPRRPGLAEGAAADATILALFQPGSQSFRPAAGQDAATISLEGGFTHATDGTYSLSVSISGTRTGGNTFAASASGTVTFELDSAGTADEFSYAFTSITLGQSAPLTFSYQEWTGATLVASDIGSATVNSTQTSGSRLDGIDFQGFAWEPLLVQLSSDRSWGLPGHTWTSLTVTLSAGAEAASFTQTGTRTLAGSGTRDLAELGLPGVSGLETYSYSGELDYTWTTSSTSSFSLSQAGSYAGGVFSLTSTLLLQSGSHSFSYEEHGELTIAGDGVRVAAQSFALTQSGAWGGGAFAADQAATVASRETYSFGGGAELTYAEFGAGSFARRAEGIYSGSAFSLSSLLFDQSAEGGYSLEEVRAFSVEGDGTRATSALHDYDGDTALGGSTGVGQSSFSHSGLETYHFLASLTETLAIEADAGMSLRQAGTQGGAPSLSSFLYGQAATESLTQTRQELRAFDGTGSFSSAQTQSSLGTFGAHDGSHAGVGSGHASSQETYAFAAEGASHLTLTASDSFTLNQAGTYGNGSYALSAFELESESAISLSLVAHESTTFSGRGASATHEEGSSLATLSGASASGTGLTSGTFDGTESFSYSGEAQLTLSATISRAEHLYEFGSYSLGSFSLSSLARDGASTVALAVDLHQELTTAASGLATTASSGSGTGASTDLSDGELTFGGSSAGSMTSWESYSYSQTNNLTLSLDLASHDSFTAFGSYAGGTLTLGSLAKDASGEQTFTLDLLSAQTLNAAGGGASGGGGSHTGALDRENLGGSENTGASAGSYSHSGSESFTLSQHAQLTLALFAHSSFVQHAAGSQVGHDLSLSCYLRNDSGQSLLTLIAREDSSLTAAGSTASAGQGSGNGTVALTGPQSYTNTANESYTQSGESDYTLSASSASWLTFTHQETHANYAAGSYADQELSLSSFGLHSTGTTNYSLTATSAEDLHTDGWELHEGQAGYSGAGSLAGPGGVAQGLESWSDSRDQLATFEFDSHQETSLTASGARTLIEHSLGTSSGDSFTLTSFSVYDANSQSSALHAESAETQTITTSAASAGTWGSGGTFTGGLGGSAGGASRIRSSNAQATFTAYHSSEADLAQTESSWLHLAGVHANDSFALTSISYSVDAGSQLTFVASSYESGDVARSSGLTYASGSAGSSSYGGLTSLTQGGSETESSADHHENTSSLELRTTEESAVLFLGRSSHGSHAFDFVSYQGEGTVWMDAAEGAEVSSAGSRGASGDYDSLATNPSGFLESRGGARSGSRSASTSAAHAADRGSLLSYAWSLSQEGEYGNNSFALDSIAYEAYGESADGFEATYEYAESGSGDETEETSGEQHFSGSVPGGAHDRTQNKDFDFDLYDEGYQTYTAWSTFGVDQKAQYQFGRHTVTELDYWAFGGSTHTTVVDAGMETESTGTLVGTSSGHQADQLYGAYTFTSESSTTANGTTVVERGWQTNQTGFTSEEFEADMDLVLIANVTETSQWNDAAHDTYSSSNYTRAFSGSTVGEASANGQLYQAGGLEGDSWSVSSYNFQATGQSASTYTETDNSSRLDAGYDGSGAFHCYTSASTATRDERREGNFALTELGTKDSNGSFVFTSYQSETNDRLLGTYVKDTTWSKYNVAPPPPPGLGLTNSWSSSSATGHREGYVDEYTTLAADGTGAPAAFSFAHYDKTASKQTNETYHEEGAFTGSIMPPMVGSWVLDMESDDHREDITARSAGSGQTGLTTFSLSAGAVMTITNWVNGSSTTQNHSTPISSLSTLVVDLPRPEPTNLHAHPNHAISDFAVGKNLHQVGILVGVTEGIGGGIIAVVSGGITTYEGDKQAADESKGGNDPNAPPNVAGGKPGGGEHAVAVAVPENDPYAEADFFGLVQPSFVYIEDLKGKGSAATTRLAGIIGELAKNYGMDAGSVRMVVNGHGQVRLQFSESARAVLERAANDPSVDFALRQLFMGALGRSALDFTIAAPEAGGGIGVRPGAGGAMFSPDSWVVRGQAFFALGIDGAVIFGGVMSAKFGGLVAAGAAADRFGAHLAELKNGVRTPSIAERVLGFASRDFTPEQRQIIMDWWRYTQWILSIGAIGQAAAKLPQSCFPAGTPVHTGDGLKEIEKVTVGDKVWAYDHIELCWKLRKVVDTYALQHEDDMATLKVRGETIRATGGHPFWVVRGEGLHERPKPVRIAAYETGGRQEGRWVLARDLRPGDQVLLREGLILPVEAVTLDDRPETVYNFTVDELQNYAVGACGVLVHNTNDPAPWTSEARAAQRATNEAIAKRFEPVEEAAKPSPARRDPFQGKNPKQTLESALKGRGAIAALERANLGLDVRQILQMTLEAIWNSVTKEQWHTIQKLLTRTGKDLRHGK